MLNTACGSLLGNNLFLSCGVDCTLGGAHAVKGWLIFERLSGGAHSALGAQVLGVAAAILLHLLDS